MGRPFVWPLVVLLCVGLFSPCALAAQGASDASTLPTVADVQPFGGPALGGTPVHVTGHNLGSATVCSFNGTLVSARVVNDSLVSCSAPPLGRVPATHETVCLTLRFADGHSSAPCLPYSYYRS